MTRFVITYRDEFEAIVEAKNEEEALKKFQDNKCTIKCLGNCWREFFEVDDLV
jgi:hypothetical protein